MTQEQRDLLQQARESLTAGKEMRELGHHGYAASRDHEEIDREICERTPEEDSTPARWPLRSSSAFR